MQATLWRVAPASGGLCNSKLMLGYHCFTLHRHTARFELSTTMCRTFPEYQTSSNGAWRCVMLNGHRVATVLFTATSPIRRGLIFREGATHRCRSFKISCVSMEGKAVRTQHEFRFAQAAACRGHARATGRSACA